MIEEIKKIIKSLEGKVVAFGFKTDKYASVLNSNKKIISFDILDEVSKKNKKKFGKNKTIYISDIRKKYKKNKVDYILIDVDIMDKYMIYLIKDTIYIGKNLYLFGNKDKANYYLNKYKRYNIDYKKSDFSNKSIIYIDMKSARNGLLKDKIYLIKDKIELFINILVDILTS